MVYIYNYTNKFVFFITWDGLSMTLCLLFEHVSPKCDESICNCLIGHAVPTRASETQVVDNPKSIS